MEGKGVRAVIMGLLILGLVVAQIEAIKSCCRNNNARNCYNVCRLSGNPQRICANLCDCIHITGAHCPASHPRSSMRENYSDDVIEQVTTDLEASQSAPIVICSTPEAKHCFKLCRPRFTPEVCSFRCGCVSVAPGLDLN